MTVLHYVQRWLPLSEQFVHAQVSHSCHRAVVVSRLAPENRAAFPQRPFVSIAAIDRVPARVRRPALTASLAAVALTFRARVVHVHFGYRVHDVTGLVHRLRLPLVVSLHGHDVTAWLRDQPDRYTSALQLADAVIVPSRFLVDAAVAAGARADRVTVIPAGVDTSWFIPTPIPPGAPVALFVGRFVEKKGLDVLAQAWPHVRAQLASARLRVLGYGPLEALAHQAGAGVEVVVPEPARRADQVRDELRAATVLVSPSRTGADGDVESLLLANLEAQASARPVVTTRHGGIPEYVSDGATALVVPEGDPVALADALIRVLGDRDLAATLGAAGPSHVARLDVSACSARVDDLYEGVLGK